MKRHEGFVQAWDGIQIGPFIVAAEPPVLAVVGIVGAKIEGELERLADLCPQRVLSRFEGIRVDRNIGWHEAALVAVHPHLYFLFHR